MTDDQGILLLWMDVETDGLDPMRDHVLELGLRYTDADLNMLDSGCHLVIRCDGLVADGFIRRMHGPNGLLDEITGADAIDEFSAVLTARDYVQARLADGMRVLAAGSTVRFDRAFIDALSPMILKGLSHRALDVSAIDEAARMWWPHAYADRPGKTTDHRCEHCLDDSLRLAAYYRRALGANLG